jgi:hypothetical protein
MHREFFRYAIPFSFGRPPTAREKVDLQVGSSVAIQFADRQFLISARHVVVPALQAVATAGASCLAGNVEIAVTREVVSLSTDALDVATIRIPLEKIEALERDGYLIMRPGEWPPPTPTMMDPILTAGFPGAWRRQISWDAMDLPGTTKLGLVHQIRDVEFVCQLDPAFVDQYTAEQGELSEDELPGMSGGPAILVRQEVVLTPRLCGIVKQGWTLGEGNRLLYFARLDRVRKDGAITT